MITPSCWHRHPTKPQREWGPGTAAATVEAEEAEEGCTEGIPRGQGGYSPHQADLREQPHGSPPTFGCGKMIYVFITAASRTPREHAGRGFRTSRGAVPAREAAQSPPAGVRGGAFRRGHAQATFSQPGVGNVGHSRV